MQFWRSVRWGNLGGSSSHDERGLSFSPDSFRWAGLSSGSQLLEWWRLNTSRKRKCGAHPTAPTMQRAEDFTQFRRGRCEPCASSPAITCKARGTAAGGPLVFCPGGNTLSIGLDGLAPSFRFVRRFGATDEAKVNLVDAARSWRRGEDWRGLVNR